MGSNSRAEFWRLRGLRRGAKKTLSDSPRPRNYDIYRVPSGQSVEDHGYVPQKKTEDLHTPGCLPGPHHLPSRDTHVGLFGRFSSEAGKLTVHLTPPPA